MLFSAACTIQLEDKVIITGGECTATIVSVYNMEGWVENLPDLNTGRQDHGCGHYVDTDNNHVRLLLFW